MTGQASWQEPATTSGRGRVVRGVLVTAVGLAVAAGLWSVRDGEVAPPEPAQLEVEPGGTGTADVATDGRPAASTGWRRLPAPGLPARDAHTATWTGQEVVVWGGYGPFGSGAGRHIDGAALDPRTGTWRSVAAAPLAGLVGHRARWTGRELVVWSGAAPGERGAAYDPDTDGWRVLAADPLPLRHDHTVTWTDREVIVWGGYGDAGPQGAAYDPAADSWRVLPPAPDTALRHRHTATWTGRELVVVGGAGAAGAGHAAGTGPPAAETGHAPAPSPPAAAAPDTARRAVAMAYDPAADRWRALPEPPGGSRHDHTATWTGDLLLVLGGLDPDGRPARPAGLAYDPAADAWAVLPAPPGGARAGHAAAWTGDDVIVWGGRGADGAAGGLVYDPDGRAWTPLPDPPSGPRAPHRLLWAGDRLVVLDGRSLAAGLAYDPD